MCLETHCVRGLVSADTCLHCGYSSVWVGGHGLEGSVLSGTLSLSEDVEQARRLLHMLLLFLLPTSPLLPRGSLESKVKPSSVELENSESLFLKYKWQWPGISHAPPALLFRFLILPLFVFCLSVSRLSVPIILLASLPPSPLCWCLKVERRRRTKVTSVIWFRPLSSLGQSSDSAGPACCSFSTLLQSATAWPGATAVTGPSVVYK